MYRKLQPQVQLLLDSYTALRSRIYISGYSDGTMPFRPGIARSSQGVLQLGSRYIILPSHEGVLVPS
jgi:hypothetical protein